MFILLECQLVHVTWYRFNQRKRHAIGWKHSQVTISFWHSTSFSMGEELPRTQFTALRSNQTRKKSKRRRGRREMMMEMMMMMDDDDDYDDDDDDAEMMMMMKMKMKMKMMMMMMIIRKRIPKDIFKRNPSQTLSGKNEIIQVSTLKFDPIVIV